MGYDAWRAEGEYRLVPGLFLDNSICLWTRKQSTFALALRARTKAN